MGTSALRQWAFCKLQMRAEVGWAGHDTLHSVCHAARQTLHGCPVWQDWARQAGDEHYTLAFTVSERTTTQC